MKKREELNNLESIMLSTHLLTGDIRIISLGAQNPS